ncbi:MAG: YihY/virulence factor BrkB family protein [Ignavibacteriaceae bacterium]
MHYFGGLINRMDEHHIFLLAGGLAFSIFVCIIPFALIVFAVVGTILNSEYMQFQVNGLIDTIIPYQQYSEFVKRIIFTRINEVIEYKNLAGIIGGLGLLFAASGLFSSMRTILNSVLGSKNDEHFILAKLKDFALVIMVILIFFITTVLMPFVDILRQKADQFQSLHFLYSGIFEHVVFSLLSLVLVFILFSVLYFAVPRKKLGKKATFISAFWAAILWETAKQIFGYYIYHFSALGKIYGTYVLFVVVAFWIYYSSIVFIIGAELGKLYSDRRYAINKGEEIFEEE